MSISIILPESLELVTGTLSWTGFIPADSESIVINTVVRSVKTGNWTILVNGYIDPEKHGFGGNTHYDIYVSIGEETAEWGTTPPWIEGPTIFPSLTTAT
jgi:hypothetical protein